LDYVAILTLLTHFGQSAPDPGFNINIPILPLCAPRDSNLALLDLECFLILYLTKLMRFRVIFDEKLK